MFIVINILVSLILTLVCEIFFLCFLTNKKSKYDIYLVTLTNVGTNLFAQGVMYLLTHFVPEFYLSWLIYLIIIELIVIVLEFFIYYKYYKDLKIAKLSIIINVITTAIGVTTYIEAIVWPLPLLIGVIITIIIVTISLLLNYLLYHEQK